jgi:transmembrane sensor
MNAEEYMLLYEKYISGACSEEEQNLLFRFQDDFEVVQDHVNHGFDQQQTDRKERILNKIKVSTALPERKTIQLSILYKVAAVLLLTVGLAFLFSKRANLPAQNKGMTAKIIGRKGPILPGKSTATLILSNGTVLKLDSLRQGTIATVGYTAIRKSGNGSLEYSSSSTAGTNENVFNTINVPVGGNYSITLPDGTLVWLNSASSLTYPVEFKGSDRSVKLKGEAYFEVSKNKQKPFIVNMNSTKVEVLGTHFNIKAYESDQIINTTLLEGSVRLSTPSSKAVLVPGQQGTVNRNQENIQVKNINTSKSVAWKNGYFLFQDDSIREIMDQVSRWYDVDVEYRGDMKNKTFGGIYSKTQDINELLKGLEYTKLIHFKIEGRRIIVMA